MTARTLLAAAVAAAALVPAPAALATCHICFVPIDCEEACGPLYEVLAAFESETRSRTGGVHCETVETATGSLVHCHG